MTFPISSNARRAHRRVPAPIEDDEYCSGHAWDPHVDDRRRERAASLPVSTREHLIAQGIIVPGKPVDLTGATPARWIDDKPTLRLHGDENWRAPVPHHHFADSLRGEWSETERPVRK